MIRRIVTVVVLSAMTACDEHVADGPGRGDHTPPGVVAAVAWDITHVEIVFDEPVTRWSAEDAGNYGITGYSPRSVSASPTPGLTPTVFAAALHDDNRTVTLTTFEMMDETYKVQVAGVTDGYGNAITRTVDYIFAGTDASDTTPPELVYRLPAPDAAGISTRTFVTVGFSEAVDAGTIFRGLRVAGDGARLLLLRYDDLLRFTCGVDSLRPETRYTVSLTGVRDLAGNAMPYAEWTFDTQLSPDITAPAVIASYPARDAIHVDVSADLSLTFSEPMDPYSVILRPKVTADGRHWSNGNRKLRLETEWMAGSQYTVQIRPGEMSDQAGNASTQLFTLTFSTGESLETGGFAGAITGDPGSARVGDPTGGLVFAGVTSPNDLYTTVVGIVGANDGYDVAHLPDGTYYPFYVTDSDRNGIYQPKYGDAVGIYGVSDELTIGEPQTVEVADTRVTGIDFEIHDPTAVCGLLAYGGVQQGPVRVGLFRPEGFDPSTSTPVVATTAVPDGVWDYVINTLDTGSLPSGSYYVMAYLDADQNEVFDPSYDPMGVYGGATPIAVDLSGGKDARDVGITLRDPGAGVTARAIHWPDAPRSPLLQRVVEMLGEWSQP